MFNSINYSANFTNISYFYQIFLLSMLIFDTLLFYYHATMMHSMFILYTIQYILCIIVQFNAPFANIVRTSSLYCNSCRFYGLALEMQAP